MKKIIVLVLTAFTFFGCGDDVEFNTPSFKANKNGNLWEGVTYTASINDTGVLTITASDNFETITLVSNSAAEGEHDILTTSSFATLTDIDDVFWSTNNVPDPSVQLYPASGLINLTKVDIEGGVVSGEFYFNAFNNSGLSSVNFNEGVFFDVPLNSAIVDPDVVDVPCDTAIIVTGATGLNFAGVMPGDANYATLCNAYKTALMTQITSCGDADGSLQVIVDGLDCTATGFTSEITVNVDGVARTFDTNVSVTLVGTTKTIIAEDSVNTDFVQFDIEQNQTGTDIVNNFIIVLNGLNHEPIPGNMTLGEFTTSITANSNSNISGTVSGAVNDYAGGLDVGLSMGIININY